MDFPVVDKNDDGIRPAGPTDECFYCRRVVGRPHGPECVCVTKKVLVKAIITYEIEVPYFWDKDGIEFHRNEGSWCANNLVDELENLKMKDVPCLCENTEFEFIKITDDVPRNKIKEKT